MYTLRGQLHTTNAANSTVLPDISRLQLLMHGAPPRLRNTLRYQTGFDHGHGLTTEWKRVGRSKRFMALDSLVPFACSKWSENETNMVYHNYLFLNLFLEIVSQATATTTLMVGAENISFGMLQILVLLWYLLLMFSFLAAVSRMLYMKTTYQCM